MRGPEYVSRSVLVCSCSGSPSVRSSPCSHSSLAAWAARAAVVAVVLLWTASGRPAFALVHVGRLIQRATDPAFGTGC